MNIRQLANNQIEVINTDADTRQFFSYNSHIATYNGITKRLILTHLWNYSKTTSKWLYKWLQDAYIMPELAKITNKSEYIQGLIDNGSIDYIY